MLRMFLRILDSVRNGQWDQAKRQLQEGCKTKPEEQAYRLARVCCALTDPADKLNRPDLAKTFMGMFHE